MLLFAKYSYDYQLVRDTQFCNNRYCKASDRLARDQLLPFTGNMISLTLEHRSRQICSLDVENREMIIGHLFFGVQGHHVLTSTNLVLHLS